MVAEVSHSHRDIETNSEDVTNTLMGNTRCCCFPSIFTPSSRRSSAVGLSWWERVGSSDDKWWSGGFRALKKLREWSEIVAGPRWKTFIRRFNRSKSGGGSGGGGGGGVGNCYRHGKFQYDPLSYALNFDEGPGQNGNLDEDDEYHLFRNFSTRYASVPGQLPAKSSNSSSSSTSSTSTKLLSTPLPLDSGRHVAVST